MIRSWTASSRVRTGPFDGLGAARRRRFWRRTGLIAERQVDQEASEHARRGAAQESRHRLEWLAAGLRRAAQAAGVQLTVGYSRRLATDGLASAEQLGVTRLGNGVVIHTASDAPDRLPVVVGYADRSGQWCSDGRRFVEPT